MPLEFTESQQVNFSFPLQKYSQEEDNLCKSFNQKAYHDKDFYVNFEFFSLTNVGHSYI